MSDITTHTDIPQDALPKEHSIYLGMSRKFNLIRSAIFVAAMGLFAYSISGDPAQNLIFIALIVVAAICYEIGLGIYHRNKNTILFRPATKELVINDDTFRFQDVTLETSTQLSPLLWLKAKKNTLSLMPAWNPSHRSVRTWTPLDILVLSHFVKTVGDTQQQQLFKNDWLPLAQRKMKVGHVPVEQVTDADADDNHPDQTS